ncbi:MAG: hypothetical protein HKN07_00680 [Acidimicrobiia bacterium]|nr:hypothetical protein [Acidimicrobiia bacterium]NNF62746.1 hypothetical protein [Acidimicrobiia bacterium]
MRLARLLFFGVVALIASACAGTVPVIDAVASGDGTTVFVSVNSCNAEPEFTVEESDDTVTITANHQGRLPRGEDCADGMAVVLDTPLGDRQLVDGATGDVLEVRYEPWNQHRFTVGEYRTALENAASCFNASGLSITASVVDRSGVPELDVVYPDLGDGESLVVPDCMDDVEALRR